MEGKHDAAGSCNTNRNIGGMVSLDMIGYACAERGCQTSFANIPGCLEVSKGGVNVENFIGAVASQASA